MLKRKLTATLTMLLVAGSLVVSPLTGSAFAQGSTDEDVYRENSDISKIFNKLGRGIVNVFTGWIEIPKQVAKEWRKTDPFTGTVLGLLKGFAWGVARTFAGFYEVISFPFPVPRNYEPIMEPEYVLPTVWGERLPLYEDEFVGTANNVDAAVQYSTSSQQTVGSGAAQRNSRRY